MTLGLELPTILIGALQIAFLSLSPPTNAMQCVAQILLATERQGKKWMVKGDF